MEDQIARLTSRFVTPFIQLYGIYIIMHGHLSPGGGFSGGAIFGASLVLLALSFNLSAGTKQISHSAASALESGGALGFALTGLAAIVLGGFYLANGSAGFPLGRPGELFSGGVILLITIFIGMKVSSTVVTLFYNLIEGEVKDGDNKKSGPKLLLPGSGDPVCDRDAHHADPLQPD